MHGEVRSSDCFGRRAAQAGHLVADGQWASGHAIASKLLRCAEAGGWSYRDACAQAATTVMCSIRTLLDN